MGGLVEKSERFLKICILVKKQNLIEKLFECRKEKNLAARRRHVSFIEFERVFEDFPTSVAECSVSICVRASSSGSFEILFVRPIDRRSSSRIEFEFSLFLNLIRRFSRKKCLPVSLFPVPGVVSFKMLLFERVGAHPKHADTDDPKAMELLTRCGAI